MNINNYPANLISPVLTAAHQAYGWTSDAVFRSHVSFPSGVTVCDSASCEDELTTSTAVTFPANVTAVYSDVQVMGVVVKRCVL